MLRPVAQQLFVHRFTGAETVGDEVFPPVFGEAVESACKHEVVEYAAVDCAGGYSFHKIVYILEFAAAVAFVDNFFHHIYAYAFYG